MNVPRIIPTPSAGSKMHLSTLMYIDIKPSTRKLRWRRQRRLSLIFTKYLFSHCGLPCRHIIYYQIQVCRFSVQLVNVLVSVDCVNCTLFRVLNVNMINFIKQVNAFRKSKMSCVV